MKTLKKLMLLAVLALAPTAIFAADHIVFIHGYQLTGGRADTWDRMVDFMTNSVYGTPFVAADKVLVVQHGDLNCQIEEVARDVWDQIERGFPDGTHPAKMDFVVHSMGGLVLRSMVEQNKLSDSRIDRVVTLATPHFGQRMHASPQQCDQEYGSEFIWKLATTSKKISAGKVLCVVGTKDRVVEEWSAALEDKDCFSVRYVKKDHTAFIGGNFYNDAICFCQDKRDDVVYRLVTDFLSSGTVVAGSGTSTENEGAVLFQVVDGRGKPVAYDSANFVSNVKQAWRLESSVWFTLKSPEKSMAKGIGAVYYGTEAAFQEFGLPTGSYVFDMQNSKDNIFSAFTTEPIEVKRGRTTVQTIYAESVRPLDYVFLIDTTGSMGGHIDSVKSNAKNLIETKLLNGARDCRVAVVDYRDFKEHTGDSNDYEYKVRCEFTTDAATAISAINSLSADGGGDGPESVYSGIHACIEGNGAKIGGWRQNAIKTIMVLGDAPPHDPEPVTGYTAADVTRWANTLKVDGDDTESGIIGLGSGISIYPVLTDSSSSLRDAFSGIAEETGGKVVSSSDYSSVADAVEEVIMQSMAANGFETEIVTARETDGNVTVRIFGGNETEPASIGYQIVSGSAESGKDFIGTDGIQRLSWAAGERSYKEIVIPVSEDSTTSNDKFFSIVLCDPSGMGLGGINVCRVNLLDKDSSGEYSVRDIYVQGVSRNTEMGSVTGSGFSASGAAVTLTAVAKPGYVFTSWENGSTSSRRSITGAEATSDAVDGVTTCVASFIPLADLPVPTIEPSGVVTGIVKEAFWWNLNYYSMSEATAICSGLPPGLTFADGVVSGTPTRQGRWTATFTVNNAKGATSENVQFVIVSASGVHVLADEGTGGVFDSTKTTAYNGYLIDDSGNLVGFFAVKVNKVDRTGACNAIVTIQTAGGKKQTIKGTISAVDGTGQGALAGLTFTASGVTGTLSGYSVDGAIDASKSKDAATVAVLNNFKGKSYAMALEPEAATGANAAMANGIAGLSIVFSMRGKTKVTGTMPDGTKVSVSSQLIVGSEWCCLPVVYSKAGSSLAFLLWFDRDGNFDSVSGMTTWKGRGFEVKWNDEVAVSKVGNLSGTYYFNLAETPTEIGGAEVISELLPVDVAITPAGAKWNIAKAKAVKLDRSGNLSYGDNPSGLKLTYTAKTGMFKGSLSLYTMNGGRLKKNKVTISGIVVNGVGHGTATLKNVGCWSVTISTDKSQIDVDVIDARVESEKAEVLPGDAPIISTDGSISTADFKARITGIALLSDYGDWGQQRIDFSKVKFMAPQSALDVPYGCALFRIDCSFPEGYSGDLQVCVDDDVDTSGIAYSWLGGLARCKGNGVAYCCIIYDKKNGNDLNVRHVSINIRADPNPEGFPTWTYEGNTQPTSWKASVTGVDIMFRAR